MCSHRERPEEKVGCPLSLFCFISLRKSLLNLAAIFVVSSCDSPVSIPHKTSVTGMHGLAHNCRTLNIKVELSWKHPSHWLAVRVWERLLGEKSITSPTQQGIHPACYTSEQLRQDEPTGAVVR